MTKGRFIWDRPKRKFVPYNDFRRNARARLQIIEDMEPVLSPIDGSVIGGRRQKRDHLRAHGCVEYEDVGKRKEASPREARAEVAQSLKDAFEIHGHGD